MKAAKYPACTMNIEYNISDFFNCSELTIAGDSVGGNMAIAMVIMSLMRHGPPFSSYSTASKKAKYSNFSSYYSCIHSIMVVFFCLYFSFKRLIHSTDASISPIRGELLSVS